MLTLLQSIKSKFTATSALTTAFPGGYWRDRAPEGTAFPYLVSVIVVTTSEEVYGKVGQEDVILQFTAYGIGHDTIGAAIQAVITAFDEFAPASDGTTTNVLRTMAPRPRLTPDVDQDGNEVWAWDVTYRYTVGH